MAAYCTTADVKAELATVTISSATTPTEAQVTSMIVRVSAEINGVLRARGVTVPPSDDEATDYVKTLAVYGTVASVLAAKFGHGTPQAAAAEERYRAMLGNVRDGALDIYSLASGTHFAEGMTLDSTGETRTAAITREMTW